MMAPPPPATLVISAGACGALAPELAVGALVVPETVLAPDGRRLPTAPVGHLARHGALVTTERVLEDGAAKSRLWLQTSALAVDMESAPILLWASAHGLPAAVVRGVSDPAGRGVPADLARVVQADGRTRPLRAVSAVLSRPGALADALSLRAGTAPALKTVASARVLARRGGDRRALEGAKVEFSEGDLLDAASVRRAVAGVQTVFHVAADYRLWTPDPPAIYRANVDGTRTVLEAAAQAGVARIVHTSSVGALGIPKDGAPGTEDTPVSLADMVGHYKRSKFLGEQVALDFAHGGAPVVVVNPSAPVGPWDVKPTPTG